MLSIIICSKSSNLNNTLEKNITETIGVKHEIVFIDNSKNNYSIFSAYNKGVSQAKFPYLCFVHEDVLFHTSNWGQKAVNHLKVANTGIIGMAGSQYLFDLPSSWFKAKPIYRNLIQAGYDDGSSKTITFQQPKIDVVAVDGFCFFMPKEIFSKVSFDSTTFNGFHFYDLDICMQVLEHKFKIYLVNDILAEHSSLGSLNKSWIEHAILFYNKWQHQLPITSNDEIKISLLRRIKAFRDFLLIADKEKISSDTLKQINKIGMQKLGSSFYLSKALFLMKK